jgi:RNA polymerase-binding protein DksA
MAKKKVTQKKAPKATQKKQRKAPRKTSGGAAIKPEEVPHFQELLLKKRGEILGVVNSMKEETLKKERSDLSNVPFHMADAGSDNYELENTLGLMDEEIRLLALIDEALERIENGTYGICVGSGKPIGRNRLEAIPWARYSVEYAELMEKGLVDTEQSSGKPSTLRFPDDEDTDESEEEEEQEDGLEEIGEAMVMLDEDHETDVEKPEDDSKHQ